MLTIELTEKDLRVLQLMIGNEIKDNESKIIKIREDGGKDSYCLIDTLNERNEMLSIVKDKLHKTKRYVEEEEEC